MKLKPGDMCVANKQFFIGDIAGNWMYVVEGALYFCNRITKSAEGNTVLEVMGDRWRFLISLDNVDFTEIGEL